MTRTIRTRPYTADEREPGVEVGSPHKRARQADSGQYVEDLTFV